MSSYRYVNSNLHTAINVLKMFFFFWCCCRAPFIYIYFFFFALSSDANDSDFRPPCELQFKIRQNAQLKKSTKKKKTFALWQRRGTASREKNTHTHPLFRKESVTKPRTIKGGGGEEGVGNERIHRVDCNFTRTAILNEIKIVCTFQSAVGYKKEECVKNDGQQPFNKRKNHGIHLARPSPVDHVASRRSRHLCKNKISLSMVSH